MSFRLKQKIIGLAALAAFLPVLVLLIVTAVQKTRTSSDVGTLVDQLGLQNIKSISQDVRSMCASVDQIMQKRLDSDLNLARELISRGGGLSLSSDRITWNAVNQFSEDVTSITLPRMNLGNRWMGQVSDFSREVPVVDEVGAMMHTNVTIFQRMNDKGDMLRIATNVRKDDGTRAVGTFIPATNPNGTPNEVIKSVLSGKTFRGRAYVVNQWYLTAYEPLKDASGNIIGMIYSGTPLKDLTELRQSIMNIVLGKDGYVYVLGGKGEQKGMYIISAGGKRDGDNIWESKDEKGVYFIQELVNNAVELNGNDVYFQTYYWDGREKVAAVTYYEPWDWVIGAGVYMDDFREAQVQVNAALTTLLIVSLISGLLVLAAMSFLAWIVGSRIAMPIIRIKDIATEIARGDLTQTVDVTSNDEVGELAESFRDMTASLQRKAKAAEEIARGNLAVEIEIASNADVLGKSMQSMKNSIDAITKETVDLTNAIRDGRLNKRGDASRYDGSWKTLLSGINELVEAFVKPIQVTSDYVTRISKGDIPKPITETYSGDFNEIKEALNTCIAAIGRLVNDTNSLVKSALDGDLDARVDTSAHGGDYARIIDGINKTLDAVVAPIQEASDVLKGMSKGDLTVEMRGSYKGDYAIIKGALNSSLDSLNDILGQVAAASEQVKSGSNQVSDASQSLSQGATEQASSLEEVTASLTEIGGQTAQNAENASQANNLVSESRASADKGQKQMVQMLDAMRAINDSASQISRIIKVIDEIAFQTNLLALNAAVEAARAGQHGKGFAVVAEEVRSLAQRSATAARETADLIEDAVRRAENGSEIAESTSSALNEIVSSVAKVSDLVGEINMASKEQTIGIQQVNDALTQIDQVTQGNTSNAEESAAAAEELSSQATHLQSMISRFILREIHYRGNPSSKLALPTYDDEPEEDEEGESDSNLLLGWDEN